MKRSVPILSTVLLLLFSPARAQFGDFPAADRSLGALNPEFFGTTFNDETGFFTPRGISFHSASGKLFVADFQRNRVLRFANLDSLINNQGAEMVFGQPDFTTLTSGLSNSKLNGPSGIHVDTAGNLWVAEQNNHRVLRFSGATTATLGATADLVLGQADFTSNSIGNAANAMNTPTGVIVDALGHLWVSDGFNNRVIRFANASSLTNGASASSVLGQNGFGLNTPGQASNRFDFPTGLVSDTNGVLWVADFFNNRVLRFDDAAGLANGSSPDATLGQAADGQNIPGTDQTSFDGPTGLAISGSGTLFVVETNNRRVVSFLNAATKGTGSPADNVIGQPDFATSASGLSARKFDGPNSGVALDNSGRLFVSDSINRRVLRFSPDLTAPTLTITSKTPRKTTLSRLALKGTASDGNSVARVEFRVGGGAFRTTTGTTSWSATAKLKKGRNTIQVKATDTAGNVSPVISLRSKRVAK